MACLENREYHRDNRFWLMETLLHYTWKALVSIGLLQTVSPITVYTTFTTHISVCGSPQLPFKTSLITCECKFLRFKCLLTLYCEMAIIYSDKVKKLPI